MAEKKQKTPIELMADLLAEMTARATEAERQRDEAKQSSDDWYQRWKDKDEQLKKTESKLEETAAELAYANEITEKCEALIRRYEEQIPNVAAGEQEGEQTHDDF